MVSLGSTPAVVTGWEAGAPGLGGYLGPTNVQLLPPILWGPDGDLTVGHLTSHAANHKFVVAILFPFPCICDDALLIKNTEPPFMT